MKANHSVIGSFLYNPAPGLNSFTEFSCQRNEFRTGQDYEATHLITGLVLGF